MATATHKAGMETGEVEVADLIPFMGLCCIISSCYLEFPNCCGAVSESTLCCTRSRIMMCKPGRDEDTQCKCCLIDCDIVPCTTCIQSRTQVCCLDLRSSLPCSEELPCIFTVCFWTLFYKYGCVCDCCADIKTIDRK